MAPYLTSSCGGHWQAAVASRGVFAITWRPGGFDLRSHPPAAMRFRQLEPADLYVNIHRRWRVAGFGLSSHAAQLFILIPIPALAVLFALLPLYQLYLRRILLRNRSGTCRTCGYDLRATPGRCPECGTPIPVRMGV